MGAQLEAAQRALGSGDHGGSLWGSTLLLLPPYSRQSAFSGKRWKMGLRGGGWGTMGELGWGNVGMGMGMGEWGWGWGWKWGNVGMGMGK